MSRSSPREKSRQGTEYIDLHVHSTFSDSTLSPLDIVKTAKERGLCAVAVTDHDSGLKFHRNKRIREVSTVQQKPGVLPCQG